jgi:phosphocarrier protein
MNDAKAPSRRKGLVVSRTATIVNQRGLHARAAAKFVKLASTFTAEIFVTKSGQTVSGLSIMGLMMLAAGPGSEIAIEATGTDAEAAADALLALIAGKFEEA